MSKRIKKHKTGKRARSATPSGEGFTVRSGFEAKIVEQLRSKKIKFEYENLKLKYTVPESTHTYTPDFLLSNGVIIEAKGIFDADTRKRMLCVRNSNPDLDIRMLLMRNNPIRKGSKTKYSDWCDKNNFKWAIGSVPEAWLQAKSEV